MVFCVPMHGTRAKDGVPDSSQPGDPMQKSLSERIALPHDELAELIQHIAEPLLVTHKGEPKFVAQSLNEFESMVRRLRALEGERRCRVQPLRLASDDPTKCGTRTNLVMFPSRTHFP
jgi:hypothetical protein